jgi:hypothetical protein
MNPYLDPIRRFPWLIALAVPIALIAALLVIYDVGWGSGTPSLTERNKPTYHASVQVLVTSKANPYVRAQESPQSQALLDAANYLPFLIESDRVAAIRTKRIGAVPGEVTAQALFARVTNRGLNESAIPIIEVTGSAPTPVAASSLAQGTVNATVTWLTAEQSRANVGPAGRVVLQRLRAPTVEVEQKSSTGLAALVLVVVLLGFVALAWVLDRVQHMEPVDARLLERLGVEPVPQNGPRIGDSATEPVAVHGSESSSIGSAEEAQLPAASERRWA